MYHKIVLITYIIISKIWGHVVPYMDMEFILCSFDFSINGPTTEFYYFHSEEALARH